MALIRGCTSYLSGSSPDSIAEKNAHPELALVSVMMKWAAWSTTTTGENPNYVTSVENALIASIDDCHTRGYGILLRFSAGIDSPIGMPGTAQASWMFGHATKPVGRLRTFDNETSLYDREVYIPDYITPASYANYRFWYNKAITRLATLLNANDVGGHPRWNHVLNVTASLPTENGTEMSLGPGTRGIPTYTGGATLAASRTSSNMALTLGGSTTGYLTGSELLKISLVSNPAVFELVHQTSRSGTAVTLGKRGHSGTVARAWTAAEVTAGVKVEHVVLGTYAMGMTSPIRDMSVATYGATPYGPAPYDHIILNTAQWDALGTLAARKTQITQAWTDNINDMMSILPASVQVSLGGGGIWSDNMVGANSIVDNLAPLYGTRFVGLTTNLTNDYPTTHPNEHAWLLKCKAQGASIVCQTENVTKQPEPTANVNGPEMQDYVKCCEDALFYYGKNLIVLETGQGRYDNANAQNTIAYRGWPGGLVTQKQYLLTAV